MAEAAVRRAEHGDGSVLLSGGQAKVLVKRPSATVLVLMIVGPAARDIGPFMFNEIAAAFPPEGKITLFIDLQQAAGTPITVEVWVRFLSKNLKYIARVVVLASNKSTSLTANVIDHFVRQDKLFEIFSEQTDFQSRLAQAISEAHPLP